jgi:hypothetical protein
MAAEIEIYVINFGPVYGKHIRPYRYGHILIMPIYAT